jgi:hypothetical protein
LLNQIRQEVSVSRLIIVFSIVIAGGALAMSACGDSPTAPNGNGTMSVRITDSPYSDAKAFLVTFTEVTAHRENEAWLPLPFLESATRRTCDLKKLQGGVQDVLGVGSLPTGHYTQIRIEVAAATIYFDNPSAGPACSTTISAPLGRNEPVVIPSGTVRLNREFDVSGNGAMTMLLDFDGEKSVHETGNGRFMMQPVISIVSVH